MASLFLRLSILKCCFLVAVFWGIGRLLALCVHYARQEDGRLPVQLKRRTVDAKFLSMGDGGVHSRNGTAGNLKMSILPEREHSDIQGKSYEKNIQDQRSSVRLLQSKKKPPLQPRSPGTWHPVQVGHTSTYIQSAIVSLKDSHVDTLHVWLSAWARDLSSFFCCFYDDQGGGTESVASYGTYRLNATLSSVVFGCEVAAKFRPTSVAFSTKGCGNADDVSKRLPVEVPEARPGEVALCTKVVYDDLDPQLLYEWFELQQLLGVTKVVTFQDSSLSRRSRRVLEFYRDRGVLDILPFAMPATSEVRRDLWTREMQRFADEDVTVQDCFARLGGFSFVSVLDFDELLVANTSSKQDMALPALLSKLARTCPDCAVFEFMISNFILNWKKGVRQSSLFHMRHVIRTEAMREGVKTVYIPPRCSLSGTHRSVPLKPYSMRPVPPDEATIFHYCACRYTWTRNFCLRKLSRHHDSSLLLLEESLRERLRSLRHHNPPEPFRV